jgi:hypothetical protein
VAGVVLGSRRDERRFPLCSPSHRARCMWRASTHYKQDPGDDSICRSVSGDTVEGPPGLEESSRTVETDVIRSVAHFTATGPRQVGQAYRAAVAALLV